MPWVITISGILLGVFLSAFFSGSETGLYCLNRLKLQVAAQHESRKAHRLMRIKEDERGALFMILGGTNFANYIVTVSVAYLFDRLLLMSSADTDLYTIAIVTPVLLVFSELLPKNLYRINPDRLMLRGSGLLTVFYDVFRWTGITWLLSHISAFVVHLLGKDEQIQQTFHPRRRIATILREALSGTSEGAFQSEIIDRVVQLSETPVSDVMVPRNRVLTISRQCDRNTFNRIARETRFSRLPVYDSHHHRIVGVVRVDELLADENWRTVGQRMHPILTLRAYQTVASAIATAQESGHPLAVVSDRSGLMLGIVGVKDLVEQMLMELAE